MRKAKVFLGLLITLALTLSVAIGAFVAAETPTGANTNSVDMSLSGMPIEQQPGENVDYYMTVSNPQSLSPLYSADAQDLTVTFYPAQADGNPSSIGTVVDTISYLAVDDPAVVIGPETYSMPTLDPGVTAAVSEAVLNGTVLLGQSGEPFSVTKQVSVDLSTEPPVGGTALPVSKLGIVAPLIGSLACAAVIALLVLRKRRHA